MKLFKKKKKEKKLQSVSDIWHTNKRLQLNLLHAIKTCNVYTLFEKKMRLKLLIKNILIKKKINI